MILGIDTTSDWSSIALDEKCVVWRGDRNQSKELLPKIEELLKKNKSSFDDLTGVMVVNGPGSYTGIRIGVSVANTIGMLKGIPVKGVDGLFAQVICNMQYTICKKQEEKSKTKEKYENVISLMSAGGRRVYGCKYQVISGKWQVMCHPEPESESASVSSNSGSGLIKEGNFYIGEVDGFLNENDKDSFVIGEVNEEVENWIKSSGFNNFELLNGDDKLGRAWGAVRLWDELPEVANNNVIPLYLREAVRNKQ